MTLSCWSYFLNIFWAIFQTFKHNGVHFKQLNIQLCSIVLKCSKCMFKKIIYSFDHIFTFYHFWYSAGYLKLLYVIQKTYSYTQLRKCPLMFTVALKVPACSFCQSTYSISQEICTRFLLCCALLWLYIDWFSHIHQAYFTGTVAI